MHPEPRRCLGLLLTLAHVLSLVSSEGCTLEQFKQNSRFNEHFDISNMEESYPDQKSLRVNCVTGYSGFFKITCSGDQWTYRGSQCQPRSCGHPGDAQFGDFRLTEGLDFVFGSRVEYTCHKGYIMASRRNSRNCMAQGWDSAVPVCEPLQCPAIYPDSKVLAEGDTENANYRNSVRFSCRSHNQILSGLPEIICNEQGEWSGPIPTCKEIKCTRPDIPNGHILGNVISEYKENDFLHYECNPRYEKTETRLPKCTNLVTEADWSPAPRCEPIKCRLEVTADDRETTYDPAGQTLFLPGETLSIQCGQKYWIGTKHSTSVVTRCQDSGKWTVDPTCRMFRCTDERPTGVAWWNVRRGHFTLGDSEEYGCSSYYESTVNPSVVACTRDGWRPAQLCRERKCDPGEVDNAILESDNRRYRIGDRITYTCMEGYTGRPVRTCEVDGWSGTTSCRGQICGPPEIVGAQTRQPSKERYNHGDKRQYTCNKSDYTFTVTCHLGEWEGIHDCSGCGKALLENGFVVLKNASTMYYRCNEGYKLSTNLGWGVATCGDGHWNGFSGQCIGDTFCGEPPAIPNGKLTGGRHANVKDSTVAVVCNEGFLAQVRNFICKNGEWNSFENPLTDVCKPDRSYCGTPPRVENAVVITPAKLFPPNSQVTYQCRHNSNQEGDSRSVCRNGQWRVNLICTPLKCRLQVTSGDQETRYDPPSKNEFLPAETLSVHCGDQYWIGSSHNTSAVTTCQDDGTWSIDPTCREVVCTSEKPSSVQSWDIQEGQKVRMRERTRYECKQDYVSAAELRVAECTRDGWSPGPLCRAKCQLTVTSGDQQTRYDPAYKNTFLSGETLSIHCGDQYWIGSSHNTSAVTTCQDDGTWSIDPTCREVVCTSEKPSLVQSWRIQKGQKVPMGERTRYLCTQGYVSTVRPSTAECTRDGWSPDPFCRVAHR